MLFDAIAYTFGRARKAILRGSGTTTPADEAARLATDLSHLRDGLRTIVEAHHAAASTLALIANQTAPLTLAQRQAFLDMANAMRAQHGEPAVPMTVTLDS